MIRSLFSKPLASNARSALRHQQAAFLSTARIVAQAEKPIFQNVAATTTPKKTSLFRKMCRTIFAVALLGTALGAGGFAYTIYRESHPPKQVPQAATFSNGLRRKTLVILGSGWGAMCLLKDLDTTQYNVVVVSPRNFFLFTPLLPSLPVGTLTTRDITEPVRAFLRKTLGEVRFVEAEATSVDPVNKKIHLQYVSNLKVGDRKGELDYDYLVYAVGAQSTTFNIPGVRENASFLKELTDAKELKAKIRRNLSQAAQLPVGDPEREKLLKFVIVGGGPTGSEFAAELRDYIDEDLHPLMPDVAKDVKISLIEALPNILPMFGKKLVDYAEEHMHEIGVSLHLNTMVKQVTPGVITAQEAKTGQTITIPYGLLVWTTGNAARPLTQDLMKKIGTDKQTSRRGLTVNGKLQLVGAEDSIYAIGDATFIPGLAPTAQVARQEAEYLAQVFRRMHEIDRLEYENASSKDHNQIAVNNKKIEKLQAKIGEFKYQHRGSLAYLGHEKAIAELMPWETAKFNSHGGLTFYIWQQLYLSMCFSWRARLLVAFDWVKVKVFGRDSAV